MVMVGVKGNRFISCLKWCELGEPAGLLSTGYGPTLYLTLLAREVGCYERYIIQSIHKQVSIVLPNSGTIYQGAILLERV